MGDHDASRSTAGQAGWDPRLYDARHSFVWGYGADLIDLLAPRSGERILDLGCGTGHLAGRIAAAGATVVGLDSSPSMVEQARQNYPHLRFVVADGAAFHLADLGESEPFDAVFSNAALHWMREPAKVAACVWRALRPGGRFVAELGGKGNVESVVSAVSAALADVGLPADQAANPWYFPSLGEYASLLESQGFVVTSAALFDRPTPLEGGEEGLRNWLRMFGESLLAGVPAAERDAVAGAVERRLRPRLFRDGRWVVDYRRLRIVAVR